MAHASSSLSDFLRKVTRKARVRFDLPADIRRIRKWPWRRLSRALECIALCAEVGLQADTALIFRSNAALRHTLRRAGIRITWPVRWRGHWEAVDRWWTRKRNKRPGINFLTPPGKNIRVTFDRSACLPAIRSTSCFEGRDPVIRSVPEVSVARWWNIWLRVVEIFRFVHSPKKTSGLSKKNKFPETFKNFAITFHDEASRRNVVAQATTVLDFPHFLRGWVVGSLPAKRPLTILNEQW